MDIFLKAAAGILVALILYLILLKQGKDFSLLLTVTVCAIVIVAAVTYLEPVVALIDTLQDLGQLDENMLHILLRAVGIGLIAEITSLICSDSGNAAMGKTLQLLACTVVLWLSIPLFTEMIDLIREILQVV